MNRQIPGNQGQCHEKQRPQCENRDRRGSKEPDNWGIPSNYNKFGPFISKISDISLKYFYAR